jgi:hypothetical protein
MRALFAHKGYAYKMVPGAGCSYCPLYNTEHCIGLRVCVAIKMNFLKNEHFVHLEIVDSGPQYGDLIILLEHKETLWLPRPRSPGDCTTFDCNRSDLCKDFCKDPKREALCSRLGKALYGEQCEFMRIPR